VNNVALSGVSFSVITVPLLSGLLLLVVVGVLTVALLLVALVKLPVQQSAALSVHVVKLHDSWPSFISAA
jgi:hypothetical protein